MRLLFLHGWGLDANLWDGVRAALPEFETVAWDRGYFGAASADPVAGPVVAVGHSLGAMLLAGRFDRLVAVNGFDRFTGENAVPPRVVERMRKRFGEAPREVLADFRARIGAETPPERIDAASLAADLETLASNNARHCEERSDEAIHMRGARSDGLLRYARNDGERDVLILQGGADPLLPAAMRASTFAGARRETLAEGGHLLPLTHPQWVADHLRAFAA
ncbi:alpha/beta fold hydrolase [Sphingomonas oryzagri]|uniref:Alpha/beta fold hydrolase n=1 Tax=Sphingomonas oryzagri TaxID=3042314 RepID=A0ABT6N6Q5_9SPHN|nr:alpha/beta fold hydrolase [Sphingomonas oryzagri]MDH7640771.1 alpha/beta fold hydrolase [Sphingomonas oryzagri]